MDDEPFLILALAHGGMPFLDLLTSRGSVCFPILRAEYKDENSIEGAPTITSQMNMYKWSKGFSNTLWGTCDAAWSSRKVS